MKTALLISTYNWPEALELVFKSIVNQTQLPDEIMIADDGSGKETKIIINKFKEKLPILVNHIWQEDKGFRKTKILNKAIAASSSEYIIQIDGDCILHKNFIEDHKKYSEKGVYLYGSRVNISSNSIKQIFDKQIITGSFFSKYIKKRTRTLRIPFFAKMYKKHPQLSDKIRGCNLSFYREDFILINGYDENFEGWGAEDSDLTARLLNSGVLAKRLRYAGILFHIYHKEKSKHNSEKNYAIVNYNILNKVIYCANGVSKYLETKKVNLYLNVKK